MTPKCDICKKNDCRPCKNSPKSGPVKYTKHCDDCNERTSDFYRTFFKKGSSSMLCAKTVQSGITIKPDGNVATTTQPIVPDSDIQTLVNRIQRGKRAISQLQIELERDKSKLFKLI